jgi:nicotinate-nucleotide pyrophosphorylase (carboxylating)
MNSLPRIDHLIDLAIEEDAGLGDVTSRAIFSAKHQSRGIMDAKQDIVLCGLGVAARVFKRIDETLKVTPLAHDGDRVKKGARVLSVTGPTAAMLTAERTALNFVQRLSGTATLTRQFVDAAAGRIVVLDTRKTTPGLRALEKYAVRAGGGVNHRGGLDQGILIKDNHVRLAGGVHRAVTRMRASNSEMPTEVEAQSLEQVDEALAAGAEIILLDNLSTPDIVDAVKRCAGRAKTEISGGVTLLRMPELAATGADYVSIGALTHSAPAVDLSLEIYPA